MLITPNQLKKLIKECINDVLKEYSVGGYSSTVGYDDGTNVSGGITPMTEDGGYHNLLKGKDYATVSGLSYHLKEEGCDTKISYEEGNHRLMVRRDHLQKVFEMLKDSHDGVELAIAERLNSTHFKTK